jgi:hypothetical protein
MAKEAGAGRLVATWLSFLILRRMVRKFSRGSAHLPPSVAEPTSTTQPAGGVGGHPYLRYLSRRLLPLVLVMLSGAGLLWWSAVPNDAIPEVRGGLLLAVEAESTTEVRPTARIDAKWWPTGSGLGSGPDYLRISVEFSNIRAGTRWFLVASGDYKPPADLALNSFCSAGQGKRDRDVVRCVGDQGWGDAEEVEYRLDDGLGAIGPDGSVHGLTDYDGYRADESVVVTGLFTVDEDASVEMHLPVPALMWAHIGSEDYVRLPPLFAGNQGDFGLGEVVGEVSGGGAGASLAVLSNLSPVREIVPERLLFSVYELLLGRRLLYSTPPTYSPDNLFWIRDGGGLPTTEFAISNPQASGSQASLAFLAGVLASLAGAAALIVLEQRIHAGFIAAHNPMGADRTNRRKR